jgi:hypothetical protein
VFTTEQAENAAAVLEPIHIELRRGPLHLSVRRIGNSEGPFCTANFADRALS